MSRRALCAVLGTLLSIAACDAGPSEAPEEFAHQVAAAVAHGDWTAYRTMALARAGTLAGESNPTATRGTFSNLVDADEGRIRADFDRAVRSRPIRALSRCRAVVDATEPDRWQLHVEEDGATGPRLFMTLQRYDDSYRVVHLYVR